MASEWETQVRTVAEKFKAIENVSDLKTLWKENLNLGHRTLGRLLLGNDLEKIIERHDEANK